MNKQTFLLIIMGVSFKMNAGTIDTAGQEPYEQCGYCHEYDGNSIMPSYPKLAAQNSEYIKKQLRDFRSGVRLGQMQATAELLSDEDIDSVARYFSDKSISNFKSSKLTAGQKTKASDIYFKGYTNRKVEACSTCHGVDGKGSGLVPSLAGQHKEYLYEQLVSFKSGTRTNDQTHQMQEISQHLNENEMELLASFIADMRPGKTHNSVNISK